MTTLMSSSTAASCHRDAECLVSGLRMQGCIMSPCVRTRCQAAPAQPCSISQLLRHMGSIHKQLLGHTPTNDAAAHNMECRLAQALSGAAMRMAAWRPGH